MSVARFSWVPNLYNIHFLVENHRPQPDPVNCHGFHIYIYYVCIYNVYIMNFQSRCEFGCLERGTVGGYGFEVMVRYDGTVLKSGYGTMVRF